MLLELERDCFYFENKAREKGYSLIAGVDEAGRGPLAGPVVAAACILPQGLYIEGVDDSKSLTPSKRAKLFDFLINSNDIKFGIGIIDSEEIDRFNILQATFEAMKRSVESLAGESLYALVDGSMLPKWQIPSQAIVKGDSLSHSISAASIIAKETRDRMMKELDGQYPGYGFAKHKGYGTKAHLEAIVRLGPCPIHRRSFEPIKSMVLPQ